MTIVPIARLGVRDVWSFVRHGLERLCAEREEHWIPEEVFAELVSGRVTLYLMKREPTTLGFFIARANADIDGVNLFVWIMWTQPHAFTMDEVLPQMDALARSVGAKRIRAESGRKGWVEKGFAVKRYVYERELSNMEKANVSQNAA